MKLRSIQKNHAQLYRLWNLFVSRGLTPVWSDRRGFTIETKRRTAQIHFFKP
jgi:hypothetical protein